MPLTPVSLTSLTGGTLETPGTGAESSEDTAASGHGDTEEAGDKGAVSSPGSVTPGPLISEVLGTQERLETGVVWSLVTWSPGDGHWKRGLCGHYSSWGYQAHWSPGSHDHTIQSELAGV